MRIAAVLVGLVVLAGCTSQSMEQRLERKLGIHPDDYGVLSVNELVRLDMISTDSGELRHIRRQKANFLLKQAGATSTDADDIL